MTGILMPSICAAIESDDDNARCSPVKALLLHYTRDGVYSEKPVPLEGHVVTDDIHGRVLEFALPNPGSCGAECSMQIPVEELGKFLKVIVRQDSLS